MAKNKVKTKKVKAEKETSQKPDIPKADAIKTLEKEIIEHAKLIATGRANTVYPIVERAKQIIELEKAVGSEVSKEDF